MSVNDTRVVSLAGLVVDLPRTWSGDKEERKELYCWGRCEESRRDSILKPVIHLKDRM